MGNRQKVLLMVGILLAAAVVAVPDVGARVVAVEKGSYALGEEEEVVDDDLYVAAETVTVNGTVNGDLYAAGGVVTVDGNISGDVFAAGGVINIGGIVGQDLRTAGGNINVSGAQIGDSLSVFAGNAFVDKDSTVAGGVNFGGGSVVLQSPVGRGVLGGGGNLVLSGAVGKDVEVGAGKLTLESGARVGGDLLYASEEDASIAEEASVAGEIVKKKVGVSAKQAREAREKGVLALVGAFFGFKVWSFVSALIVGTTLLYFFSGWAFETAEIIRMETVRAFLWGLAVLVLTVPVLLVVAISVVGIPLALILGAGFATALYMAKIFVGLCTGGWLVERFGWDRVGQYAQLALGLFVIYVLTLIPFFSFFVSLAVVTLGLGATGILLRESIRY